MSEDAENKHQKINQEKPLEIHRNIENVTKNDLSVGRSEEFISNQFQELKSNLKTKTKIENYMFNQQTYTMDPTLHNELQQLEDISSESENVVDDCFSNISETCKNSSGNICTDFEGTNSEVISNISNPTDKEIISNQLIVLEPNNPVMVRFQNTLKQHLLKQKDKIKQELQTLDGIIRTKQNEKSSFINEINSVVFRVKTQQSFLSQFHKMKMELKTTNEQIETCINQGKKRCTEIITKIAIESKKCSVLKAQLDCTQGLLKELSKYEKEQEITFNMCNQKKSQAKQYKKKLLNKQQKQDLLLLSLTQEILRLEDRMKQLGEQAETKYNERELLKQKVVDNSTDLDAINGDNTKITLLWNEVLIIIQQRDKSFQKIKNDFHEAKNKYHTLLIEANSYKRSAYEETQKNYEFLDLLNKFKQEKNNLQNGLKAYLDKFNCLKDEHSKLIQITEFQLKNLDQVLFDQKTIKNESSALLNLLDKITNQKSKYEEDILDELKKQLVANNFCVQINNKISELKVQNKENEFILVGAENNLSHALLKLEQYRTTISNIEKDVEENIKILNNQGYALSTLDIELNKLYTEIQNKSRQIDLENKQLETIKQRYEEGYIITPQIKIDQIKCKIDEVEKEIDFIKQSWIQKQNKNVQLLGQRNKQLNELSKIQKYVSIMETKGIKIEQEITFLSKDIYQYKRTLTNMRNTILKLNANFNQNKGRSIQIINENEWIQCTYLAELKENEKQCLEYKDQLKLLKNDLNELQNVYIEKQCESKSWNTKVRLLVEMKKEMKNEEGDLSDISAMKNEIHRMQIKESQLKKTLEKIMLDLEVCISRREMIYNKVAAKDIRLKGKNEIKQKIFKKLDNLRINIKKIKIECKKLDRNINDLEDHKLEFQKKTVILNDKLIKVQKTIDDSIRNIEDIAVAKIKNIHNLCYKQNHAKFLDEVKKGKYHLLVKSELKMDEEFSVEWKKNADVISVVEALKNDFPYLDFQIARLMYTLKSIDS